MLWLVLPLVKNKKKNHGRSIIHWAFSFQKLAPTPTFEAVDVIYSYIYSSYFYLALNVIIDLLETLAFLASLNILSLFAGVNNRKNWTKLTLIVPEKYELTKSEALFRLVEKARGRGGGGVLLYGLDWYVPLDGVGFWRSPSLNRAIIFG